MSSLYAEPNLTRIISKTLQDISAAVESGGDKHRVPASPRSQSNANFTIPNQT